MENTHGSRRQCLRWSAGLLVPGFMSACGVMPPPSWSFTRDELQAQLSKTFPLDRRVLGLLDVRAEVPTLNLSGAGAGAGRLGLHLPLKVRERLSGANMTGNFGFSALPRWDATERAVRLSQVQVTEMKLADSGGSPSWLQRLGSFTAENLLEDLVVYRLSDDKVKLLTNLGWRVGALRVEDDAIRVQLVNNVQTTAPTGS